MKKEGFTILQGMSLLILRSIVIPANYTLYLIIWITNPKNKNLILNENKTLSFIKKYPLSILLGIVFINLMIISAHLRVNSKLAYKEACSRYLAFYSNGTDQQAEKKNLKKANKLNIPIELVDGITNGLLDHRN